MTHLHYALRTLSRHRLTAAVSVLSIGLGLIMSSLLFARVAYDNSVDSCFADTDRLYAVMSRYVIGGQDCGEQRMNYGTLAGAIASELAPMIEGATMTRDFNQEVSIDGREVDNLTVIMADTLTLRTLGVKLVSGSVDALSMPGRALVSTKTVAEHFGGVEPIGRTIETRMFGPLEVAGVYEDWGTETTLPAGILVSQPSVEAIWPFRRWNGGDSWYVYVRLRPDTDVDAFTVRLNQMFQSHAPDTDHVQISLSLKPIRAIHSGQESVRRTSLIFSLLGGLVLLVTALNYVLLCLASLGRRSRVIGVHKTSGAGAGTIASMFSVETLLVFVGAMAFGGFCFYLAMRYMNESIFANFAAYLTLQRLWLIGGVCVAVFLLAAGVPAWIFARVPAERVYRRTRAHAPVWKRTLLFVEFAITALMMSVLAIISTQYDHIMNLDPGFNPHGLAYVRHTSNLAKEQRENIYRSLPMVEDVGWGEGMPGVSYSGEIIDDGSGRGFSTRIDWWESAKTPEVEGIRLLHGRYPTGGGEGEVVVNEEFCRLLGWDPATAVGRVLSAEGQRKVVGVVSDFTTGSWYEPQQPFAAVVNPGMSYKAVLRLKPQYANDILALEAALREAFPTDDMNIFLLSERIADLYKPVVVLRTLMTVAVIVLLAICLIGLTGYMADEMRRRTREIAVRKVNGASTSDIVHALSRAITITAIPAVALGAVAAWLLLRGWLDEFSVQSSRAGAACVLASLLTLLIIIAVTVSLSLRAAAINPVNALKTE